MEQVEVLDIKKDIFDVITHVLGKVTVIHDFVIKENKCEMEIGLIIKKLFDVRFGVKIKDKLTAIKLCLNKKTYRMYMITSSIILAIKTVCNFIRCLIFGDKKFAKQLNMFTLSRKEYQQLKRNKKEFKKELYKLQEDKEEALVIYLSDKFYSQRDRLKLEYGI